MNKTNLKPLAWGLLGAGVAVMGTAGALDLPSWLRHSGTATATAPGAGGTSAAIAAAATGQQVATTPVTPPLPALPPGTAHLGAARLVDHGAAGDLARRFLGGSGIGHRLKFL